MVSVLAIAVLFLFIYLCSFGKSTRTKRVKSVIQANEVHSLANVNALVHSSP